MAAGASAYLAKPIKQQEMMAALQLHCSVEATSSPMAILLPRFFACAGAMLDEMAGLKDPEALAISLHRMRGMIAVYGFADFAEQLRMLYIAALWGETPEPAVFEQLRQELRQLETVARAQA